MCELSSNDIKSFGDKAFNMAVLLKNGCSVLDGYAVSCDVFSNFYNWRESFAHIPSTVIQSEIQAREFTPKMEREIYATWLNLSSNIQTMPLIVRSSAIGEDGLEHSFAGIYESILNIRSFEDMKTAIKKCWASYYSDQADKYRLRNGTEVIGMGVIVQKMVTGDKSGVLFTANPITGNEREMIIEASYGLNVGVVDGTVSADRYSINSNGEITSKTIAQKKIKYSLGQKSFELQIENVENNLQQSQR